MTVVSTERYTTKEVQHRQAFLALAGSTKPKAIAGDNGSHNSGYQLSLLSMLFISGSVCAHIKRSVFIGHNSSTQAEILSDKIVI